MNNSAEKALDYLQDARQKAALRFVLGSFDLGKAPRLAPAARAVFTLLGDGELSWKTAIEMGARASDVLPKTVDGWLRQACVAGVLTRAGTHKSYFDKKLRRRVVTVETRVVSLGPEAGRVSWSG